MTGYRFHPDALLDLEEIWDFIAQDNAEAADDLIDNMIRKIELASQFPADGAP